MSLITRKLIEIVFLLTRLLLSFLQLYILWWVFLLTNIINMILFSFPFLLREYDIFVRIYINVQWHMINQFLLIRYTYWLGNTFKYWRLVFPSLNVLFYSILELKMMVEGNKPIILGMYPELSQTFVSLKTQLLPSLSYIHQL